MAQQVQLLGGRLGMVPSWQFETDPALNPNINPHVKFPDGWNQLTVQPVGQYRTSGESQLQGLGSNRLRFLNGLGVPMSAWAHKPVGIYRARGVPQFSGVPSSTWYHPHGPPQFAGIFDTTWWRNRKWLAFGLIGVLGLGAAALATKVLR